MDITCARTSCGLVMNKDEIQPKIEGLYLLLSCGLVMNKDEIQPSVVAEL